MIEPTLKFLTATCARLSGLALVSCVALHASAAQPSEEPAGNAPIASEAEPRDSTPTEPMIEALLRAARLTKRDVVVTLGAGEGRIPIVAAKKFGARAIGIESNPKLVEASRKLVAEAGVSELVSLRQADPMQTAFNEATVLFAMLAPVPLAQLRPRFLALRPGTRILGYQVGIDSWEPDALVAIDNGVSKEAKQAGGMLWIVPANVAGTWRLRLAEGRAPHELVFTLLQRNQRVDGDVHATGIPAESIQNAIVRGDRLSFLLPGESGERAFYALIRGDAMTGVATDGVRSVRFRADRAK